MMKKESLPWKVHQWPNSIDLFFCCVCKHYCSVSITVYCAGRLVATSDSLMHLAAGPLTDDEEDDDGIIQMEDARFPVEEGTSLARMQFISERENCTSGVLLSKRTCHSCWAWRFF